MKLANLALPSGGTDVVSQESSIPKGFVRRATNVVLQANGNYGRRPGETLVTAIADLHSLWTGNGFVLGAAGAKLYALDVETGASVEIFTGLLPGHPVEYCVLGTDIYFCSTAVLGKITSTGLIRKPGVANVHGYKPTLGVTVGTLLPGKYGVAYSLVNDLGEESGLSNIEWMTLSVQGGIQLSDILGATNATKINVYLTTTDSGELYLNQTVNWTPVISITEPTVTRKATKQYKAPLIGGTSVRTHKGRLYTAVGSFLYYSDAFDPGLYDLKSGWISFGSRITGIEVVTGGIFVGQSDRVYFLHGNSPSDFQMVVASHRGMVEHTSSIVPADFLEPRLAQHDGPPVAVWLTDVGAAVGKADGQVITPQASSLRLKAPGGGRFAVTQQNGIKQGIFLVESMTMGLGVATDTTL
jgi:hypothetical protein